MLAKPIESEVRSYLRTLSEGGVRVSFAVVYGDSLSSEIDSLSDIDTVVVSPDFDNGDRINNLERLWSTLEAESSKIEPFPCGEAEWETDFTSRIIETARREGIKVEPS